MDFLQEPGKMGVQFADAGIVGAARQMNNADAGDNLLDTGAALVFAGEDVHLDSRFAHGPGQLPDVDIHTPRLPLSGSGQGAGVERNERGSLYAQLRFTTIL